MDSYKIINHQHDAIVIGAGGSGLRATMGLAQSEHSVACISKVFPTRSHTVAAQGGISGAWVTWVKMIGVGICTTQ